MARKISLRKINNILAVLLIALVAFNFYQTIKLKEKIKGQQPTYTPAEEKTVETPVNAILLTDSSCTKCVNLSVTIQQFKRAGVNIASEKTLERNSQEGKALTEKYKIQIIPTIMLSKELGDYSDITDFWQQVGTVEKDGSYVTRSIMPPYVNLTTGKIAGIVELTLLTDKSCKECYNVSENIPVLESFGIALSKKEYIDISSTEGKQLLQKYSITAAPTILLSPDAKYYNSLQNTWKVVGTIENDGIFVFRNFTAWQGHTYKDLTTGKVVTS